MRTKRSPLTTGYGPDADVTEIIRAARKILEPTPVKVYRIPPWLRRRLCEAVKAKRLPRSEYARPLEPVYLLDNAARLAAGAGDRFLDHWGRTDVCGRDCFVTEPYHPIPDKVCDEFCRLLDPTGKVVWETTPNSWHFPGRTYRYLFWEGNGHAAKVE